MKSESIIATICMPLALHGSKDERVKAEPQQKSMTRLEEWGAEVTFKNLDAKHKD
ncbi:MAG: hypothetical protein U5K69_24145 [Balneolaceae bacterium]|nr:hypothetical protein [Balneolaceae bacterium]